MERYLIQEIRDIALLMGKKLTKNYDPSDNLNNTQIQILLYLVHHSNEEVCQKDLEIETHLKKASITGTLDSLEDKGMIVRRKSNEDKRKNIVVLSEKASKLKKTLRADYIATDKKMKKDISEEELEKFFSVLDKIKLNLKK